MLSCLKLIVLFIFACSKNTGPQNKEVLEDSYEDSSKMSFISVFSSASLACQKTNSELPFVLASFNRLEDILKAAPNTMICAPGPWPLISNFNLEKDQIWELQKEPNQFIWLKGQNKGNESLYITDQKGIPLPSKVYQIIQDEESIVILALNILLTEGVSYYLYIKDRNQPGKDSKSYIQEIRLRKPVSL